MAPTPPIVDMASPPTTEYVVLVTGGFEHLAAGLIARSLSLPAHAVRPCCVPPPSEQWVHKGVCGDGHVFAGEAGVSKLHFALPQPTTSEGWAAQHTALAQLPCTQAVLAPFVFMSGVSLADDGLAQAWIRRGLGHEAKGVVRMEDADGA